MYSSTLSGWEILQKYFIGFNPAFFEFDHRAFSLYGIYLHAME